MALFAQYKQWIELMATGSTPNGIEAGRGAGIVGNGAGGGSVGTGENVYKTIGAYFERVSGGEAQYSLAEAAPANSRGMVYRSTRWRLSELTLEGNLTLEEFEAISKATRNFQHDGNGKFGVKRVLRDGEGGKLTYLYTACSLIAPISIDDGDVGRDQEFLMMRMRIQPEKLVISGAGEIQVFDPFDALSQNYFKEKEADKGGSATQPASGTRP